MRTQDIQDISDRNYVMDPLLLNSPVLQNYELMQDEVLKDGALLRREKEMILMIIAAVKKFEQGMLVHAKCALDEGATPEELVEVFEGCIVSRGVETWMMGKRVVQYAKQYIGKEELDISYKSEEAFTSTEQGMHYLKEQNANNLPEWVSRLEKYNPEALLFYCNMRFHSLEHNRLSKKFKELVLVGINAAEGYEHGLRVHQNTAEQLGATKEELAEVLLTTLLVSGGPAWIEGSKYLG